MLFPRIRTFDSSQTPVRRGQDGLTRQLAALDPTAVARALAGAELDGPE